MAVISGSPGPTVHQMVYEHMAFQSSLPLAAGPAHFSYRHTKGRA